MKVRKPAVAGYFYPANPERLKSLVDVLLGEEVRVEGKVRGLVAPHAGYEYSGRTAGKVYSTVKGKGFKRVVLVGPSHFVGFEGLSFGDFDAFETPLGLVWIDKESIEGFTRGRRELHEELPHLWEHSLEVELPFLQRALGDFLLLPVVYGRVRAERIKEVLEFFEGEDTLFIISSDLSHYYDDTTARRLDVNCHLWITEGREDLKEGCLACGKRGIEGAVLYARERGYRAVLVDYSTSAEASGERDRVVGYGGYAFIS